MSSAPQPAPDNPFMQSDPAQPAADPYASIATDNPFVDSSQKAVSPDGKVKMIQPSERATYQKQGFTMISPDGSFALQKIAGEDPLDEAKRYQRVRAALTPAEKAGANSAEWSNAAKTGLAAAGATLSGVTGTSALEGAASAVGSLGRGALQGIKSLAGSSVEETASNVTQWAIKHAIPAGGGWWLLHHLLSKQK